MIGGWWAELHTLKFLSGCPSDPFFSKMLNPVVYRILAHFPVRRQAGPLVIPSIVSPLNLPRLFGFDYPELLLGRSAKSMLSKQAATGDATGSVQASLANGEVDFSASTTAVLVLVSRWAAADSRKGSVQASRQQAEKCLEIFVGRAIGDESFAHECDGCNLIVEHGDLVTASVTEYFGSLRRCPSFSNVEKIPLYTALISLAKYQQKSAKASARLLDESAQCFRLIANFLSALFEHFVSNSPEDAWQSLPVLRCASGKARRIPLGFKLSVRSAAVEAKGVHSAAQIISVGREVKRAQGEDPQDLPSIRSAKRFVRDHMWQYMMAGKQVFAQASHLNIICDGCRVDSDELVSYLFYSTEKEVGMWGPPQALHCGKLASSTSGSFPWFRNGGTSCQAFWARKLCLPLK